MFAVRDGQEDVVRALVKGGADLKSANGDGLTATSIAIENDRFDLARTLLDLGADPNDGALFFAVGMHDATTDMRAHDGQVTTGPLKGHPILIMTSIGAKSGQPRRSHRRIAICKTRSASGYSPVVR